MRGDPTTTDAARLNSEMSVDKTKNGPMEHLECDDMSKDP